MSNVIPFRQPVKVATSKGADKKSVQKLCVDEIRRISELEFPKGFFADEDGVLVLAEDDRNSVSAYFDLFCLQLRSDADAQTTYDIWACLRLEYATGVRQASQGRPAEKLSVPLDPDQKAYVVAVRLQNRPLAQQLARRLSTFAGPLRSRFLL